MSELSDRTGPHFEIPEDDARALGLTVADLMRYRWTGELSPDAEDRLLQVYRDQTQGRNRFWVTRQDMPTELDLTSAEIEPLPDFKCDQDRVNWAMVEIGRIGGLIDEVVGGGGGGHQSNEAVTRALRFARIADTGGYETLYLFRRDPDLLDAAILNRDKMQDIFTSRRPDSERADLFLASQIVDDLCCGNRTSPAEQLLLGDVRSRGIGLLKELYGRHDATDSMVTQTLVTALEAGNLDNQTIADVTTRLLPGVVEHLAERSSKRGLSSCSDYIRIVYSCVHRMNNDSVVRADVERAHFDQQTFADSFFAAISDNLIDFSNERGNWLMHSETRPVIKTLCDLYLPSGLPALCPPDGLSAALDKVYSVKIEGYDWYTSIGDIRLAVSKLRQLCETARSEATSRPHTPAEKVNDERGWLRFPRGMLDAILRRVSGSRSLGRLAANAGRLISRRA